jgi:hypothetical protein
MQLHPRPLKSSHPAINEYTLRGIKMKHAFELSIRLAPGFGNSSRVYRLDRNS